MKSAALKKLSAVQLKRAVGIYRDDDKVTILKAAKTPLGAVELDKRSVDLDSDPEQASIAMRDLIKEAISEKKPPTVVIGLRASAVTFMSEQHEEPDHAGSLAAGEQQHAPAAEPGVLIDQLAISAAKTKYLLTGKVRKEEVSSTLAYTDEDDPSPRYEPVPWAAWRASIYHAPLRPKRGTHLRFILGKRHGLAILGNERWPLAWQLLSYEPQDKGESIIQANQLLSLYAKRRLAIPQVDEVSAQGDTKLPEGWGIVEDTIGRAVTQLEGPDYGAELIAFGLALGGLEADADCLDLARSLQKPKTLLAMMPWGQAVFVASLFAVMAGVLWTHSKKLERHLQATAEANSAVVWSGGIDIKKLKLEHAALTREVSPLEKFMRRDILLSEAVASLVSEMPGKIWLESIHASDQIWERSPNKSLGEKYLIVRCGASLTTSRSVPAEIEELVHNVSQSEYFQDNLPVVKLADINWKREGAAAGYSLFTVVSMPGKKS